jgi:hypothetical protein
MMTDRYSRLLRSFVQIAKEWIWTVLSLASGGFTVILALWYIVTGREQQKIGFLVFLGICSIFAAWIGLFSERHLRIREQIRRKPCLKVKEGDFFCRVVHWGIGEHEGRRVLLNPLWALVLRIENDPEIGTEISQITNLAARVTFLDVNGHVLFSFEGRWSDSAQPSTLPKDRTAAELKTVDFLIGTTRMLDLVVKYHNESVAYGVNNDSYDYPYFKNEDWLLNAGEYQIRVRFRSANVDQTFVLMFSNPEGTTSLKPISCKEITSASQFSSLTL